MNSDAQEVAFLTESNSGELVAEALETSSWTSAFADMLEARLSDVAEAGSVLISSADSFLDNPFVKVVKASCRACGEIRERYFIAKLAHFVDEFDKNAPIQT